MHDTEKLFMDDEWQFGMDYWLSCVKNFVNWFELSVQARPEPVEIPKFEAQPSPTHSPWASPPMANTDVKPMWTYFFWSDIVWAAETAFPSRWCIYEYDLTMCGKIGSSGLKLGPVSWGRVNDGWSYPPLITAGQEGLACPARVYSYLNPI